MPRCSRWWWTPSTVGGGPVSEDDASQPVRRMAAVMSCSIGATVASQFPHNCQIRMQADPSLGYAGVVRVLTSEFGIRAFYSESALVAMSGRELAERLHAIEQTQLREKIVMGGRPNFHTGTGCGRSTWARRRAPLLLVANSLRNQLAG